MEQSCDMSLVDPHRKSHGADPASFSFEIGQYYNTTSFML